MSGNGNHIYIVVGGSGIGKTTLAKKLVNSDLNLERVVTYTTRLPRNGERDGDDYYFISDDAFADLIRNNFFVEYSTAYGSWYGTSKESLSSEGSKLIVLDAAGALEIKKVYPGTKILWLYCDNSILRSRIKLRGAQKDLEKRLTLIKNEEKILQNTQFSAFEASDLDVLYQNIYNLIKNYKK